MSETPEPTDSAGNALSHRESKLAKAAEREVERLIKAKSMPKWWGKVLLAVCLVLAVVVGYLGYQNITHPVANQLQAQTSTLRQQNITNCENNNLFRASQIATWEKNFDLQAVESKATGELLQQLVGTLVSHDPKRVAEVYKILAQSNKDAMAEQQQFLVYVKHVDAPKNCQVLYAPVK